jgi:hypothetical protein
MIIDLLLLLRKKKSISRMHVQAEDYFLLLLLLLLLLFSIMLLSTHCLLVHVPCSMHVFDRRRLARALKSQNEHSRFLGSGGAARVTSWPSGAWMWHLSSRNYCVPHIVYLFTSKCEATRMGVGQHRREERSLGRRPALRRRARGCC